jgi:hypothetical protein
MHAESRQEPGCPWHHDPPGAAGERDREILASSRGWRPAPCTTPITPSARGGTPMEGAPHATQPRAEAYQAEHLLRQYGFVMTIP